MSDFTSGRVINVAKVGSPEAANIVTVCDSPVRLYGVYINTTLSAHAVSIQNGTTEVIAIPASASAGTHYKFDGLEFGTSMRVVPNIAATGAIVVEYRPGTRATLFINP